MRLGLYTLGQGITCSLNPHKTRPSTLLLLPIIRTYTTNTTHQTRVSILKFPLSRTVRFRSHRPVNSPPPVITKRSKMSLASAVAITYNATVNSPPNPSASPEDVGEKLHHLKSGGFQNPWPSYKNTVLGMQFAPKLIKVAFNMWKKKPEGDVKVIAPAFLERSAQATSLRATWLGHACYYVEFPGGFRALFDPVFSNRCSPVQFMGPERFTKIPCNISDIPAIDAVIISHNHYDHLDYHTIKDIQKYHPSAWFFVGLGNAKWFHGSGVQNVTELDWWEERDIVLNANSHNVTSVQETGQTDSATQSKAESGNIVARIGCLPCQHGSARGVHDQFGTLWASWSVESGGKKVWFAGDTGYRHVPEVPEGVDDYGEEFNQLPVCPAFKQIGDLRGPFDLGFLPIGAYNPRGLFSSVHANPYDSVNIFLDTKCQKALGMHWGTWMLTLEPVLEPPQLLRKALAWKEIPEEGVFDVIDIGVSREY